MIEACFKKVSGVCQEHFKDVSRVLLGCFKVLSKEFQASLKDVSRVSQTYSKVFQGSFMLHGAHRSLIKLFSKLWAIPTHQYLNL